jgi:hypothetical protein
MRAFEIFQSNEEEHILRQINGVMRPEQFTEREIAVIENLIRKSLVHRVHKEGNTYLVRNAKFS